MGFVWGKYIWLISRLHDTTTSRRFSSDRMKERIMGKLNKINQNDKTVKLYGKLKKLSSSSLYFAKESPATTSWCMYRKVNNKKKAK